MIVGFDEYKSKYNFEVTGIIHVGAHVGQEYDEYINTFGPVETHWFEPVPDVFDKLQAKLFNKPQTYLYNFGLGEKTFRTKIFVDKGNDGQSSSILKPKLHTEQFPHIEFIDSERTDIKVERLDNFEVGNCNMLVIDTQGYELEVLKGSTGILQNIDYIFTEFNTIEMYENCPTLEDLDDYLKQFDFFRAETYYTDGNWGDALYIKNNIEKSLEYIAIVDCFVHKKEVEYHLLNCIERLKEDGIPILLISNTAVTDEIIKKVDFFLYDKRNQLFSEKYTGVRDVDLWKSNDIFEAHEIKSGLQKHGLSVLVNLYNGLNLAKSLGYKHFFRFEVDDNFGPKSREYIKSVPRMVRQSGKKSLFYFNEGAFHNGVNDTEPNNISFHFMYSEIDFFLESIPKISNESDYLEYLHKTKGNSDFEIAEEFIYNNLVKSKQNLILKKSGLKDMANDFPDTEWNKIVSESNMSDNFKGCTTLIYQERKFPVGLSSILNAYKGEETDKLVILSFNYRDYSIKRSIEVVLNTGQTELIIHELPSNGSWSYHVYSNNVSKIRVYEDDKFLYEDITTESKNYIVFK